MTEKAQCKPEERMEFSKEQLRRFAVADRFLALFAVNAGHRVAGSRLKIDMQAIESERKHQAGS